MWATRRWLILLRRSFAGITTGICSSEAIEAIEAIEATRLPTRNPGTLRYLGRPKLRNQNSRETSFAYSRQQW